MRFWSLAVLRLIRAEEVSSLRGGCEHRCPILKSFGRTPEARFRLKSCDLRNLRDLIAARWAIPDGICEIGQ